MRFGFVDSAWTQFGAQTSGSASNFWEVLRARAHPGAAPQRVARPESADKFRPHSTITRCDRGPVALRQGQCPETPGPHGGGSRVQQMDGCVPIWAALVVRADGKSLRRAKTKVANELLSEVTRMVETHTSDLQRGHEN